MKTKLKFIALQLPKRFQKLYHSNSNRYITFIINDLPIYLTIHRIILSLIIPPSRKIIFVPLVVHYFCAYCCCIYHPQSTPKMKTKKKISKNIMYIVVAHDTLNRPTHQPYIILHKVKTLPINSIETKLHVPRATRI